MSKQQAESFLKDLKKNEDLKNELVSAVEAGDKQLATDQAIQKIIAFAADQGYNFTGDEYKTAISDLQPDGKLSDEELENVSGGGNFFTDLFKNDSGGDITPFG